MDHRSRRLERDVEEWLHQQAGTFNTPETRNAALLIASRWHEDGQLVLIGHIKPAGDYEPGPLPVPPEVEAADEEPEEAPETTPEWQTVLGDLFSGDEERVKARLRLLLPDWMQPS